MPSRINSCVSAPLARAGIELADPETWLVWAIREST